MCFSAMFILRLSTDVASHKMCDFRICTVLHGFGNAWFYTTFEQIDMLVLQGIFYTPSTNQEKVLCADILW